MSGSYRKKVTGELRTSIFEPNNSMKDYDEDADQKKFASHKGGGQKSRFTKVFHMLRRKNILLTVGIFLFLLGTCLNVFWNDLLDYAVHKELILSKSSRSYNLWVKNPIPLHIDFYFLNWTNPSDLKEPGYKPHFEEKGPYRFRENVEKVNLIWNDNGTVTYKKNRTWFFEAENSNGSLDDTITSLNVIALSAARTTRSWMKMARLPLSVAIGSTQEMHVTKKAGEFLFDGYSDPLIEVAKKLPGFSSQVPFDRFGWFYKRNGSTEFDGVFNMETGTNDIRSFGKLKSWNYRNRTSFYENECGCVKGSAGEFWPPKRTKEEDVVFFAPDLCRYVSFKFRREVTIHGIKGYRYDSGPELFDNGTTDPRNECFCGGECVPSGTANLTSCRFGAPGFVSYPHFYQADSSYRDEIIGMQPDSKKHDMYIILEPNLGIPLEVAARLQINILLRPDPGIRLYDGVPRIFFPMVWFEQKVTTPEDMLASLKLLLALPLVGYIGSIVLIFSGVTAIIIYFCLLIYEYKNSARNGKDLHEANDQATSFLVNKSHKTMKPVNMSFLKDTTT